MKAYRYPSFTRDEGANTMANSNITNNVVNFLCLQIPCSQGCDSEKEMGCQKRTRMNAMVNSWAVPLVLLAEKNGKIQANEGRRAEVEEKEAAVETAESKLGNANKLITDLAHRLRGLKRSKLINKKAFAKIDKELVECGL